MGLRNFLLSLLLLLLAAGCQFNDAPLPPAPPGAVDCSDVPGVPIQILAAMQPLFGDSSLLLSTLGEEHCTYMYEPRTSGEWRAVELGYVYFDEPIGDVLLMGPEWLSIKRVLTDRHVPVTNLHLIDLAADTRGGVYIAVWDYRHLQPDAGLMVLYRGADGHISLIPIEIPGDGYPSAGQLLAHEGGVYFLYTLPGAQYQLLSLTPSQGGQDWQRQTLWTLERSLDEIQALTPYPEYYLDEMRLVMMGDQPIAVGGVHSEERVEGEAFYVRPFMVHPNGTVVGMSPVWGYGRWETHAVALDEMSGLLCTYTPIFTPEDAAQPPRLPLPDDDCSEGCRTATMCRLFTLDPPAPPVPAPSYADWRILEYALIEDIKRRPDGMLRFLMSYHTIEARTGRERELNPELPQYKGGGGWNPSLWLLSTRIEQQPGEWHFAQPDLILILEPVQYTVPGVEHFSAGTLHGKQTDEGCVLSVNNVFYRRWDGERFGPSLRIGAQFFETCL